MCGTFIESVHNKSSPCHADAEVQELAIECKGGANGWRARAFEIPWDSSMQHEQARKLHKESA